MVRELDRVDALAKYLAARHVPVDEPGAYDHAVRTLVRDVSSLVETLACDAATSDRIETIVHAVRTWRFSEGMRTTRLHAGEALYTLAFDDRPVPAAVGPGPAGEPAHDVTALMIAYLARATDHEAWMRLRARWHRVWITYLDARSDSALFSVAPPWFARHAIALVHDRGLAGNEHLLELAERALLDGWLDPMSADDLFMRRAQDLRVAHVETRIAREWDLAGRA